MDELKEYKSIKVVKAKPMKYHEAGHWGYVRVISRRIIKG